MKNNDKLMKIRCDIFDAAGNTILMLDARQSKLKPDQLSSKVITHIEQLNDEISRKIEIISIISEADNGDVSLDFWNPDGTTEKVCGNALRTVPLFMEAQEDAVLSVQTRHGMFNTGVSLGTSWVSFDSKMISCEELEEYEYMIDCGTPHLVICADTIDDHQLIIRAINLSTCTNPVNVTLWTLHNDQLTLRTFERGVGETASCGTGAVAAFFIYARQLPRTVEMITAKFFSGKELSLNRDSTGAIKLTGTCEWIQSSVLNVNNHGFD